MGFFVCSMLQYFGKAATEMVLTTMDKKIRRYGYNLTLQLIYMNVEKGDRQNLIGH